MICLNFVLFSVSLLGLLFLPPGDKPCLSNPCQNDGICVDAGETYRCQCTMLWNGTNCEYRKFTLTDLKKRKKKILLVVTVAVD